MGERSEGTKNQLTAAHVDTINAFGSLDLAQKRLIASQLRIIKFKPGETIISRSDKNKDVCFLLSGQVRVCTFTSNGKEIQFDDLQPGDMFGELAAIDGGSRTGDCIARTKCTIAVMSAPDFQRAIAVFEDLNHYVICRLAQMLRNQMNRVFEFSAHSVKDRLRNELIRLALHEGKEQAGAIVISDPPTHSDFASRIGTHREAVTRELNHLHKTGVITWTRSVHQINDLDVLKLSIDLPTGSEDTQ